MSWKIRWKSGSMRIAALIIVLWNVLIGTSNASEGYYAETQLSPSISNYRYSQGYSLEGGFDWGAGLRDGLLIEANPYWLGFDNFKINVQQYKLAITGGYHYPFWNIYRIGFDLGTGGILLDYQQNYKTGFTSEKDFSGQESGYFWQADVDFLISIYPRGLYLETGCLFQDLALSNANNPSLGRFWWDCDWRLGLGYRFD
jgi:hypothetical protein